MKSLMRYTKPLLFIIMVVFMLGCIHGCAMFGIAPETNEQSYLVAVKEYTLTLEKYNTYYAKADEATKAEWKKDIDPWFIKANEALGVWAVTLNKGLDPQLTEDQYLAVKQQLFILLLNVFKVEGGD